ncbi:putative protein N(5)-glutamine methyltransferase [Micromonospora chokoriensis]
MAPPSPTGRAALVGRLRAAGCVYAEDEAELLLAAADSPATLADLTDRRVAGEPLEYLLGWAEFAGLRIAVDAGVFVPRARTALLVQVAAEVTGPAPAVVDLCCGSGATTVALAHRLTPRWLAAADIDPAAVACARRNVDGLHVEVYEGDLFAPLPPQRRGRLDLVVCNAPYVPTDAVALMPPEARLHEAPVALDGGPDGLSVLRRVGADAAEWLTPGGHLVVEAGTTQVPMLCDAFSAAGLIPAVRHDEDLDATAVVAQRPT